MAEVIDAQTGELIERVIAIGDLERLSSLERTQYYKAVCDSIGVNPLTKPFEYIRLNNKLVLYALRACTDQLRTVHGVSVEEMSETERDGVFIVTCKVKNAQGRTDMSKGAVPISGLKGEALANAIMKCETKAKRRATLSLCGLGMLDESELETIPASALQRVPETPVETAPPQKPPQAAGEAPRTREAARRPAVAPEIPLPPAASPRAPVAVSAPQSIADVVADSPLNGPRSLDKNAVWDDYQLMLRELAEVEHEEQLEMILGSADYRELKEAIRQIRPSSLKRLEDAAEGVRQRLYRAALAIA